MATKAVCCGEESVVVSVYVERPRRRVSASDPSSRRGGHHHHHHHHKVGGGYNRRADLLLYSQQLREAAQSRSAGPTPDQHPQLATNHPQHTTKIITVVRKRKNLRTPTCLGDWKKVLIPSFIKSWEGTQGKKERRKKQHHSGSAVVKMNAIFKRLDVQKKWVSITQLFSTLKKRR
ncbi:hypothetical protein MRB53_027158 [Persea americana]|uniref:Uncharacterized protein n=1 Tax=Persea americana TaxID=3435 RepID=A0ACC2LK40_PERAE|nr:hypothetical protein MRB53_027158 [Persea americana]